MSNTTLLGSPQRRSNNNNSINISPMKQRYLDSLQNTGLMVEPILTPQSPSRVNIVSKNNSNLGNGTISPFKGLSNFAAKSPSPSKFNSPKRTGFQDKENKNLFQISNGKSKVSTPSKEKSPNFLQFNELSKDAGNKYSLKHKITILNNFDPSTLSADDSKCYSFLCRVSESINWINGIISETELSPLPDSPLELINKNLLKDGVYLATIVKVLEKNQNIVVHPKNCKFPYLLVENIELFLHFCYKMKIPNYFKFESVDLFEGKNFCNVIETIHCLAQYLSHSKKYQQEVSPMINLYGCLTFTQQDFTSIKRKMGSMGGLRTFEFFEEEQEHKSAVANRFTLCEEDDNLSDFDSFKSKHSKSNAFKTPVKNHEFKIVSQAPLSVDTKSASYNSRVAINSSPSKLSIKEVDNEPFGLVDDGSDTPDVFTTSLLNQITNDIDKRASYSQHNISSKSVQESLGSGSTLNNSDLIPNLAFNPKSEENDLDYYSRSVTSQFSSPRRRRRRARLTGSHLEQDNESVTSSNYIYDTKSDYSSATYVSSTVSKHTNYQAKNTHSNDFGQCVTQFQSLIRASTVRFKKFDLDSRLDIFEHDIVSLQAFSKGYLARNKEKKVPLASESNSKFIIELQAFLKGNQVRDDHNKIMFSLLKNKHYISTLNDNIKGYLLRKRINGVLSRQRLYSPALLELQAQIKGQITRKTLPSVSAVDLKNLVAIQALIKASSLRNKLSNLDGLLHKEEIAIMNLQAIVKGAVVRSNTTHVSSFVHHKYTNELNSLSAYIKGAYLRNNLYKRMYELELLEKNCISLQASVKGLLVRYCVGVVTDYVGIKESDIITSLQASIKGYIRRKDLHEMNKYYRKNIDKVIILQSKIRSYQMSSTYRDLIDSANPKLASVAKFVHLLNGTTPVHESEDKLNNLKDVIDSTNSEISKKERNTIILAKKLTILRDNIDGVDLLDDKTGSVHKILSSFAHINNVGYGNSLNSLEAIKLYEKLLYLLQNDPFYFRVLYTENPGKIEKFIKLLFYQNNGTINKRESILIVKLITEFLSFDIERHSNLEEFLFDQDPQLPWKRLLHTFLVSTRKGFMNSILFDLTKKLRDMTLTEGMSFESDPMRIYQRLNGSIDSNLTPKEAIEIPEVNKNYVSNMIALWSFVEEVQQTVIDNLDCLPIEILHLCTKTYHLISTKSADEFDALEGISKILIGGFINDYLLNCEKYDPSLQTNSVEFKHNLQILSNSLSTVFAMRKFKGYYQQLNTYVEEIGNDIALILSGLIIPPDFQNLVDNMVYKDMSMVKSPLLTINAKYLMEIQDFIEDQLENLPAADPIIEILDGLSKCESSLNGGKLFANSAKVINLHLNPSSYVLSDVTNRSKPIYNSVMWGIVLLLQVVDRKYLTNIFEMLTHEDSDIEEIECERKLKLLLEANPKIVKSNMALSKKANENYLDLKMNVAEKLVELDRLGLIDKNSKYQSLINDISNNLKTHQYFKERNLKEINVVNDTIRILTDKLVKISSDYTVLDNAYKNFLDNLKPNFNNSGTVKKHRLQFRSSRDKNKKASMSSLQRHYSLKTLYEQKVLAKFKGLNLNILPVNYFGSGGVKYPNITFTLSTNDGKTYILNLEKNGENKQGKFSILEVLDKTVSAQDFLCLNDEVNFNSSKLFALLIKDFIV